METSGQIWTAERLVCNLPSYISVTKHKYSWQYEAWHYCAVEQQCNCLQQMACHCTTTKLSSYNNPVGHGKMLHALLSKVSSSVAKSINLKCLSSLVHVHVHDTHGHSQWTCLCIPNAAGCQHMSCHNWKHCTIFTPVFIIIIIIIITCALCTFTKRWWNFISSRPFTCLSQITLHTWTSDFLSVGLPVTWWNEIWGYFMWNVLLHHFLHLPVYCSEAHTDTQNTSTTLSTTGMYKEVLHIMNNDHTFGITDKRKNWALQTYIQKHTFEKPYIRIVKKETDHGTGSETY